MFAILLSNGYQVSIQCANVLALHSATILAVRALFVIFSVVHYYVTKHWGGRGLGGWYRWVPTELLPFTMLYVPAGHDCTTLKTILLMSWTNFHNYCYIPVKTCLM